MQNSKGNTAMHFAVEFGYHEISDYLISKGVNLDIQNLHGFQALEGIRAKRDINYNI